MNNAPMGRQGYPETKGRSERVYSPARAARKALLRSHFQEQDNRSCLELCRSISTVSKPRAMRTSWKQQRPLGHDRPRWGIRSLGKWYTTHVHIMIFLDVVALISRRWGLRTNEIIHSSIRLGGYCTSCIKSYIRDTSGGLHWPNAILCQGVRSVPRGLRWDQKSYFRQSNSFSTSTNTSPLRQIKFSNQALRECGI